MIVMKRIVPFLMLLSLQNMNSYLDEHGVPKEGLFGYRGIQKNIYCLITANWSREKTMLAAFDNVLKTNSPEDLKIFKEKFYPEDCGRHPRLLQEALEHNRLDLIEFMKEKGLNIKGTFQELCVEKAEQKTKFLKYPLHVIVKEYGDKGVALVALLIKIGFDVKHKDDQGNTLLHEAAKRKSLKMIKELKEKINVNERNKQGKTAFVIALEMRDQHAIDELIAQGSYSCLKDAKGNTLVHDAAADANSTGIKYLEESAKTKDFDPNVVNAEGETPLFVAVKNKNKDGVAFLIAKGAKTVHKNKQEDMPLHLSARLQPPSEYEAIFEELLKSSDFDNDLVDAQGKRVIDINNDQEECYCNPLNIKDFSSEEEILARQTECRIIRDIRKKKVLKRLADRFIESDRQLTEQMNAEISKKNKEARELEKKLSKEEEQRVQEAERIAQEALLRKKLHDEQEEKLAIKEEEFEKTKFNEHEKKKAAMVKFYDDNN